MSYMNRRKYKNYEKTYVIIYSIRLSKVLFRVTTKRRKLKVIEEAREKLRNMTMCTVNREKTYAGAFCKHIKVRMKNWNKKNK